MNPWSVELILARHGSLGVTERRSLSRDVERGLLIRLRQGVYASRAAWDAGEGWPRELARHVIRARAFTAVAAERPVFSHWTSGAILGLPMVGERLAAVHVTAPDERRRGIDGVAVHVFPLRSEEVVEVGDLLVTTAARTVVDIAGAVPFRAGVVTADGALTAGLRRELLDEAVDLAGLRRASGRIGDVAAFAHPGAESAAESETRVSMFEIGIEPQELQHEVRDARGLAGVLDTFDRRLRIGTEVDGLDKYLNPKVALQGAGRAVVQEKWREDRVRAEIRGLARFGYGEAREPARLRPILARVGLRAAAHRPTLADWAAEARAARPRARR
jgi:hypothetical protein